MYIFILFLVIVVLILVYRKDNLFFDKNILKGHEIYSKQRKNIRRFFNKQRKSIIYQKYKRERQRLEQENTRYHLSIFVGEIEQELYKNRKYISWELMKRVRKALRHLLNRENDQGLIQIYKIITSVNKEIIEQKLTSELKKYFFL